MKLHIKLYTYFLLLFFMFGFNEAISQQKKAKKARAKADVETEAWRYQTEPMGDQVSAQGTVQFKVWQYNKKPFVAKEQAMKNAVHAVIFRGIQSSQRVRGFRALVDSNTQSENSTYFDSFFENRGGKYMKFVSLAMEGGIGSGDVIKLKKEYKVGVVVVVRTSDLKKELENDGILKSVRSIF